MFLWTLFVFLKISFRQAERKLKEMELETAQLRNKLTMVDKKLENGTSKFKLFYSYLLCFQTSLRISLFLMNKEINCRLKLCFFFSILY